MNAAHTQLLSAGATPPDATHLHGFTAVRDALTDLTLRTLVRETNTVELTFGRDHGPRHDVDVRVGDLAVDGSADDGLLRLVAEEVAQAMVDGGLRGRVAFGHWSRGVQAMDVTTEVGSVRRVSRSGERRGIRQQAASTAHSVLQGRRVGEGRVVYGDDRRFHDFVDVAVTDPGVLTDGEIRTILRMATMARQWQVTTSTGGSLSHQNNYEASWDLSW
ncbi:hypothetical protein [Leifsonia sp. Leaf264]|uniref:hypothetical protein n=1 Tax=Leifsonia sp. Leaf264 TaxID=1736314 RepID=UPI0006F8348B|nr:hypothetical protein [Leifsonia sp. Leaf264]KQP01422.1 hypothetical protein ASF30_02050 [Leifsonia sp. Leaf264]